MKDAKNTTALEISAITTQAGRDCAALVTALAGDPRFVPVVGRCTGMRIASVAALIDVREKSGMPEYYVQVSIDCRVVGTAETMQGVIGILAENGIVYIDAYMVNSWNALELTQMPGIDVQGGKLMQSFKAGKCDFTGRAFEKGADIIWFGRTKQCRLMEREIVAPSPSPVTVADVAKTAVAVAVAAAIGIQLSLF